ncbi:PREDICTED: zinc finger protein 572-like isoform X1 [Cyphomyrmex costatus]|uniref:zinc finger protein 572-like isoform X1 n=1 Tax=Cyphomyrmex costatus TaxID=456900 RepID=UPI000852360C|nr:PREDICTED: zinc finger protein 572-like isoform X1 [Cyphomyrmex costatus]XP_018402917.1 PREDICTED: zinc finger protein 572-like isoform X1 [Cyphomyrmex costatus]
MGQMGNNDNDNITSDCQNGHDIDIENKESQKKHKCNYPNCSATFLRPDRLERHIKSHTGERTYKCMHPGCTKSYTNSSHLRRHSETHSSMKKVYKCKECLMMISTLHNLKRHYKRVHSEKKISCKECGINFNKRYQLSNHQAEKHSENMYKCDQCNKSFGTLSIFDRHQKTHEKRYPCPECSEKFENLVFLIAHKKAKHVTISDYKCDTCGKVFLNKNNLKQHSKIHCEDRLVFPCPYDNCHRFYFFKSNLEQHIKNNHLGQKVYCHICSVGLTTNAKLKQHIQRHYEPKKEKKNKVQRKKRKDAGVPKKSVLSALIGINLPNNLEKMMMERKTKINDTATTSEAS